MQRATALLPVLIASALLITGCSKDNKTVVVGNTGAPIQPHTLTFRSLDKGDTTGVVVAAGGEQRLIDTDVDFAALWASHESLQTQPDPLPVVDHANETVVAMFLGPQATAGHAIEVVDVAEVSSSTYEVRYVVTPPGAVQAGATSPFHIVAVNRKTGTFVFVDVSPPIAPPSTPVVDVHGELVEAPLNAGGTTLAFLEDGATDPQEITDPSALRAGGAHLGTTLVLSGDVQTNTSGATTLPETLRISQFVLDDVTATGKIQVATGGTVFLDEDGNSFEPLGALAQALSAHPLGRPVRVTGKIDPTHTSTVGTGLVITSWRPTTIIKTRIVGGLAGVNEVWSIDDLDGSGAYRYDYSMIVIPQNATDGRGWLQPGEVMNLRAVLAAANMATQPTIFRPTVPILDVPTTFVELSDQSGDISIRIEAGSTLPTELEALRTELANLKGGAPKRQTLDEGAMSSVTQAGVQVVRDQAAWNALWAQHAGAAATPPTVDFTTSFVVAAFQGQQSSGGYSIAVKRLERAGNELHLTVERTSPAPGQPVTTVITSPFQLAKVDHQGVSGDVYVDGVKQ